MSLKNKIRVLIIDDHDMVRKGLTVLLESFDEFEVVADIDNGPMGVTLCRKYLPDVVLMDILMPGIDGIVTTRIIHENLPLIPIMPISRLMCTKKSSPL